MKISELNSCDCICHTNKWNISKFCNCYCDSNWQKEYPQIYGSIPKHEVIMKLIKLEQRLDEIVAELKTKSKDSVLPA